MEVGNHLWDSRQLCHRWGADEIQSGLETGIRQEQKPSQLSLRQKRLLFNVRPTEVKNLRWTSSVTSAHPRVHHHPGDVRPGSPVLH